MGLALVHFQKYWLLSNLYVISFFKGGGRGGSRGSSSRGSRYGGSSTKSRSTYSRNKKSKAISTLKKAAVIGAGAYVGYKLTKAATKFSSFLWGKLIQN